MKPDVHRRAHKNLSLVPILSQINPVHALPSYFLISILILLSYLHVSPARGVFPSDFCTRSLYALLSCMTQVMFGERQRSLSHEVMKRKFQEQLDLRHDNDVMPSISVRDQYACT
jgi:hypothetical protein